MAPVVEIYGPQKNPIHVYFFLSYAYHQNKKHIFVIN